MISLCLLLLLASPAPGTAKDLKYPVSALSETLTKDVNAVVRMNQERFIIESAKNARYTVLKAVTILNEKGNQYAIEVIGYDKLTKVASLSANVYNALGEPIKRLKNADILDMAAFDGFSLYSDNRLKALDLTQATYPYTVEIEYELDYRGLLYIPGFNIQDGDPVSIESQSFELTYPLSLEARYKLVNTTQQPRIFTTDNNKTLHWDFQNLTPLKIEPLSVSKREQLPRILMAPTAFEYDGYPGKLTSWNDFGNWIRTLNAGRNSLPATTVDHLKKITAALNTREEKVKAVYEFLQNKTRYVSIQLGIGGFQPFDANVVDQTGYGDCKALSNYMVSMLGTLGIPANYVLISAGDDYTRLQEDFPSTQFNHAIAAVPNGQDTLWLECTSQTNPFGYLGSFTSNRKALWITNTGAAIVKTPRYRVEHNRQIRSGKVALDVKGNATASVHTLYQGLQYEAQGLHQVMHETYEGQKKWVQQTTQIPIFDVKSLDLKNKGGKIACAEVKLSLQLDRYAAVTGKRLFFQPNLMNRITDVPEPMEKRTRSVVRKTAYEKIDSIEFSFPEGLYPEFLPPPTKLATRFGSYENEYHMDAGKLLFIRKVKMVDGEFPPETYSELVDFYMNMAKADKAKLVLLSKT
jgi:transglutaminase-like putative cysteine protease